MASIVLPLGEASAFETYIIDWHVDYIKRMPACNAVAKLDIRVALGPVLSYNWSLSHTHYCTAYYLASKVILSTALC